VNDPVDICKERHESNSDRIGALEKSMQDNLMRIYEKLDAFGQRPTWAITISFTIMGSALVAMGMFIITHAWK